MTKAKTKAKRIMALYDGKRTTKEIAEIVGCSDAYVRVVARQRRGTASSEIDLRYRNSPLGMETRRRLNAKALARYHAKKQQLSTAP